MVTPDDAAQMIAGLPEVTEGARYGMRTWFVSGKGFAWERPFTKADIKRFGAAKPPGGPIFAFACADLDEKKAILASNTMGFFTIEHFNNYPAFLVQLDVVAPKTVRTVIVDAWLACAASKLADEHSDALLGLPKGKRSRKSLPGDS
jgi:hypothetical protein